MAKTSLKIWYLLVPATVTIPLVSVFITGCASSDKSSPQIQAWARQNIADAHAKEVADLKEENERIKAQAAAEKKQAEAAAWVASNKGPLTVDLTKMYEPNKQAILEAYHFNGHAVAYFVDDVVLEGKILYFSQLLLWQKPDGNGSILKIIVGQDLDTGKFVYDKVEGQKNLTREEYASFFEDKKGTAVKTAASTSSNWAPSTETINSGYQAAIKVAGSAALLVLANMLSSN